MPSSRHASSPALARSLHAEAVCQSRGVRQPRGTHARNLLYLLVLFRHRLHSLLLPVLEHSRARSLLHHAKDLRWLHIEHFSDLALHDQEIWVVDVELDLLEEVLKRLEGGLVTVKEVFRDVADLDLPCQRAPLFVEVRTHLTADGDLINVRKSCRGLALVLVVEHNGYGRLCDSCLTTVRQLSYDSQIQTVY